MSNTQPRRIMRLPEVMATTGYGRSSLYAFMASGDFPKCRKIGPRAGSRAVGWDSLEIESWVNAKLGGQH